MPEGTTVKTAVEKKFEIFEKTQLKLQEAQAGNATKAQILSLHALIKTQGQEVEDLIESLREKQIGNYVEQFGKFLETKKEELAEIVRTKSGIVEFIPDMDYEEKVVGPMTTGSGGDVAAAPVNFNTNLGNFNFRNDNALLNFATVTSTGSAAHTYTELEPKDGDYTFVAEGVSKPQIDFKWNVRYAEPKKTAAHIILTEESVTDIKRLQSVARTYLRTKHDLFKADKLYFGTGAGGQLKGATVYGRVFSAGSMALKVEFPNFMDIVNASIVDIYTTQNYTDEASYEANLVLVSPTDFFIEMQSAKDGDRLPLYPQASLFNAVNIGGVLIRPWAKIPAGKIFVADMKQYHLINYIPFSIRIGWINDQLITNHFTMVGESRYFGYVKNLDEQAFLYDDIATIKTAIEKP